MSSILQYAELGPVTLGWVVLLQVGVLMLDRYRYDTHLPTGKWVAVIVILAAQAYLLVGPPGTAGQQASVTLTPGASVTLTTGASATVGPRHRAETSAWGRRTARAPRPGVAGAADGLTVDLRARAGAAAARPERGPFEVASRPAVTRLGWPAWTSRSPSWAGWPTRC